MYRVSETLKLPLIVALHWKVKTMASESAYALLVTKIYGGIIGG